MGKCIQSAIEVETTEHAQSKGHAKGSVSVSSAGDPSSYRYSQQIGAALFYGISSIAIMFVNKVVLSIYHFPSSIFLAIAQAVVTSSILLVLEKTRKVSYRPPPTASDSYSIKK